MKIRRQTHSKYKDKHRTRRNRDMSTSSKNVVEHIPDNIWTQNLYLFV